jgi:endonuclease/exonuclease/phosphatase family metal-dependent hydrolase
LPLILTGDFNAYAEPPEKTVQILKSRFRSAYETVHGREPEKTWPTPVNTWDKSPAGTLDYVYVSPEWQVLDAGLCFDEPSAENPDGYPSDHIGVFARLGL